MTKAKRQPRKKFDRITNPDALENKRQITTDHACLPFDRLVREMDRKWGIDRLPELVSPELAERYGARMEAFNQAIRDNSPDIAAEVTKACNAIKALDRYAEEHGVPKADTRVIEIELDGWKAGIMLDDSAWKAIQDERPDLPLFSLREVALALHALNSGGLLESVKEKFPGAQVMAIRERTPLEADLDDEIPF